VALRRLKAAKAMLDANNRDKYYEELNKALMGYLSDKYSIAFADMNRGFIREKLAAKNLREDLVQKVMAIVEACEFARFAPGSGEQQAHLYQDTLNLITELEKQK
jgi:ketopantoate reductase